MIAKIHSAIPFGFTGKLVEVEGDIRNSLPSFNIVGMANKTINEAKERVRSALINSGFSFPEKKVTISLAPADLQKDGSYLDLPIALSILVVSGQLLKSDVKDCLFVGELSLNGEIRPVKGIINIVEIAKQTNVKTVYLPFQNLTQARLIEGIEICGVKTLQELFLHLKKQITASILDQETASGSKADMDSIKSPEPPENASKRPVLDHIRGQNLAKRALSIAVAGHHNILISGPPGAGKTLLAKAAANLLPDLTPAEEIAITKLYSIAGLATDQIITRRPFKSPHHSASVVSVIGGGAHASPGEISLAHKGVLFLDEIPEFPRSVLEALRQPLEDREISISRAEHKVTYPADFMLIATMNPCPCGYLGDPTHECTCTPVQIQNYQKKISGPLLDRIDLYVEVKKVDNADLLKPLSNETSEHIAVKNTITGAIARQNARYRAKDVYNSALTSFEVSSQLKMSPEATSFLENASKKLNLSARSYFKTIKVARTIADMAGDALILPSHLAEALTFRKKS